MHTSIRTVMVGCVAAASTLLVAVPSAWAATGRNFSGTGSTHTIAYNHAIQNASNAHWGGCSEISSSQSGSVWTVNVHCVFTT
jgi:hypothetical protein